MGAQHEAEIVACIPSLRRYARGLAHDPERADDLVQDTLERAWQRFSMWQRRGAVRAWMFGIMHNLHIDRLRSQRRTPEDSAGDDFADTTAGVAGTDRLELRDLERALQRLPVEHREVLLLVGVEELSYKEISTVIGVPIGTVMSRLSRARERLRAELEGRPTAAKIQRVK
jgi:RNA polymerase sigma-70 factor (ECF subfamily)